MMTTSHSTTQEKPFYFVGGTIPGDIPSYVPRRADNELLDGLRQGEFCYVLTSRQMGKSSLQVRTASVLRKEGVTCVILDLTAIGSNVIEEQWYRGLLAGVGLSLDLEDELDEFWDQHLDYSPLQRFMSALQTIMLTHYKGRIVIFVDEIDFVRSLTLFSADQFFAAIRECYNRRTENTELKRLSFCLLGVATPSDLIKDTRTTPFNIGRRIELTDFTLTEAFPLRKGLGCADGKSEEVLRRVLYWTGGHPYLTQKLCKAISDDTSVQEAGGVDRVCERLFLSASVQDKDANIEDVRDRLVRSREQDVDLGTLLDLYAKVLNGKRLKDDRTSPGGKSIASIGNHTCQAAVPSGAEQYLCPCVRPRMDQGEHAGRRIAQAACRISPRRVSRASAERHRSDCLFCAQRI